MKVKIFWCTCSGVASGVRPGASGVRPSSSHSSVVKKLSAIALSKPSPTEPIESRTPARRQRAPNANEVYWQP